jgi:peptidoglycan/LPS O-acetylase OafA/YrhL
MNYPTVAILLAVAATLLVATLIGEGINAAGVSFPDPNRRMGHVDGLRGYLALSVMMHHFIIWLQVTRLGGDWTAPTIKFFNSMGAGGVALFFMVTGLVFYPRILGGLTSTDWKAVYISRIFRIYPLLIVSLVLIAAIIVFRVGFPSANIWSSQLSVIVAWLGCWGEPPIFGYSDSGRINAYVLWTLWYELVFYVAALPILALLRQVTRRLLPSWWIPIGVCIFSLIAREFLPALSIFQFLPLFALGMLAFELRSRPRIATYLASRLASVVAVVLLALSAVFTAWPYYLPQLLAYGLFFVCVGCGNDFWGLLSTRGARILGECSFPIYLLHGLLLDILFVDVIPRFEVGSILLIICAMPLIAACIVLMSGALHLFVERPSIRFGKILSGVTIRQDQPAAEVAPINAAP